MGGLNWGLIMYCYIDNPPLLPPSQVAISPSIIVIPPAILSFAPETLQKVKLTHTSRDYIPFSIQKCPTKSNLVVNIYWSETWPKAKGEDLSGNLHLMTF